MDESRPSRGHAAVVAAFVLFFVLLLRNTATPPERPRLPAPRDASAGHSAVLGMADAELDELHVASQGRQIVIMKRITDLFREELQLHTRRGDETPGAILRLEHDILRRWMAELDDLAEQPMPDHIAFARRAERLRGLLEAHVEVEERLRPGGFHGP